MKTTTIVVGLVALTAIIAVLVAVYAQQKTIRILAERMIDQMAGKEVVTPPTVLIEDLNRVWRG